MSRQEEYIYTHRTTRIQRAAGFGGIGSRPDSRTSVVPDSMKGDYYYSGPHARPKQPGLAMTLALFLMPFIIAGVVSINPWLGIFAALDLLALLAVYIHRELTSRG